MRPYTVILGIILFIVSALLVRSIAKRGLMFDYDAPNSAEFRISVFANPILSSLCENANPILSSLM
jgi:hypothetical protein